MNLHILTPNIHCTAHLVSATVVDRQTVPAGGGVADNLTDGVGAALVELLAGVFALAAQARRRQVAVVVEVAPAHALHRAAPGLRRVRHADLR